MNFKDNPEYQVVFTLKRDGENDLHFYQPSTPAEGYHISRYVSAQAQSAYAAAGITPDLLNTLMDNVITLLNDEKKGKSTLRTDIGVIANQIKYRTKYPVDEDVCLRMSAIYLLMDGEDPDKMQESWTKHKVKLAKDNPDLYAFFLTSGIKFTQRYQELSEDLNLGEYFQTRSEAIRSMTPSLFTKQ
jgi:hypothetical protein